MSICRMRLLIAAFHVVGLCSRVSAEDGQPSQQMVHVEANGSLSLTAQRTKPIYETITKQYTVMVPYQETVEVEENGVKKQVSKTAYRPESKIAAETVCKHVCVMECSPLHIKTVKAFEVDGRRIPAGELAKRLTDQLLVVVSTTGEMLPDYYASIFKPGTVILVLPRSTTGNSMPGPAPHPSIAPPAAPQPAPMPPAASRLPRLTVQPVAFQSAAPAAPAVAVPAQPADGPWNLFPQSPAPRIVFASRSGTDGLKIRQFAEGPQSVEIKVVAENEKGFVTKVMSVERITRHSETTNLPLKAVQFSTSDLKDIATERIKERLGATESTVLLSANGMPVDEFWLKNIKPSVLVLRGVELPPVSTTSGMPPLPPPYAMPPAAPVTVPPAQPAPVVTSPKI